MLRVLHCIYDDPGNPWVGGGGSLRVWEIYRRLSDRVEATVASGNYPGARSEIREGVRYLRLGAKRRYALSRLSYARAASRLLAAGEYDAAVFDFSAYTPLRVPRNRPVGLVVHMLHGPTARARWGTMAGGALAAFEKRLLRSVRYVCATSEWLAAQLSGIVEPGTEIVRVGSGVDGEFFEVNRAESDFLLSYGRFDLFQKGLDTLLRAFAALAPDFPGLRLCVAGRGKDGGRVLALARSLGLESRLDFREGVSREEVLSLLSSARALLMPSRLEGLPMVAGEAMAAGLPVIATRVGAVDELLEWGRAGVLIPPDDPDALATATADLLRDPARRARLSSAARASAERFRWDRVADEHLDFLNTLAGAAGTPRTATTSE
jgi:glycosyltransferase involved in cell wall biosynthesis